eukprot:152533_1
MWVSKSSVAAFLLLSTAATTAFVPTGRTKSLAAISKANPTALQLTTSTATSPLSSIGSSISIINQHRRKTTRLHSTPADPDKSNRGQEEVDPNDDPLEKFGVDFTSKAALGQLDPVIGR